jgi:hypothetical protein
MAICSEEEVFNTFLKPLRQSLTGKIFSITYLCINIIKSTSLVESDESVEELVDIRAEDLDEASSSDDHDYDLEVFGLTQSPD